MKEPNQEELHLGGTLDRGQGGASFNPFTGSHYIRHASLGSWWERIFAILGLIFVVVALINILIRNL
jgi:hypothetical protein